MYTCWESSMVMLFPYAALLMTMETTVFLAPIPVIVGCRLNVCKTVIFLKQSPGWKYKLFEISTKSEFNWNSFEGISETWTRPIVNYYYWYHNSPVIYFRFQIWDSEGFFKSKSTGVKLRFPLSTLTSCICLHTKLKLYQSAGTAIDTWNFPCHSLSNWGPPIK